MLYFKPMTDLLAARLTMGFSLGFHIVFACIGMTMPFMMSVAHFLEKLRYVFA